MIVVMHAIRSPERHAGTPLFFLLAVAGCGLFALAGCSGQPPGRYAVSGTVTFNGKPIPAGRVFLEPDPAGGNRGPQAVALIKNGRFTTQPRKGAVGGSGIIIVQGYDGVSSDSYPDGQPLFEAHTLRQELPKESSTITIDVPASAATPEFLKSIEKLDDAR
jgi:hypothetical protein